MVGIDYGPERSFASCARQGVPIIRSDKTPVLSSPVNQLFGELIRHFGSDVPKSEQMLPVGMSAADWEFNVRRAERVLSGKKHLTDPWTALEVARKLVRGAGLCGACRTFLIRGFRINGRSDHSGAAILR